MQARACPSESRALDYPSRSQASNCWVTFESGGGLPVPAQEVIPGRRITAPYAERTGYTFEGWYTNPDFDTPWDFSNDTAGGDNITLYAKWLTIPYVISYTLLGGENSPANPAVYTVEDTVVFEPATHRIYAFAGWYDNPSYNGAPMEMIPQGSTGGLRLWARWDKGAAEKARREAPDRYSGDPKIF